MNVQIWKLIYFVSMYSGKKTDDGSAVEEVAYKT